MTPKKLRQLLEMEEGPNLDFKVRLSLNTEGEKKELTRDVIAMANTRGGRGYIIFGVEDKTKRIVGIEPTDYTEEQIQQIISNRSDPPVPISIDIVPWDGKLLGVLTVYRSNHQPHQMIQTGAFYIRRGSTTDVARREELANLFQENGLMTYETILLPNVSMDELDFDLIRDFFTRLNAYTKNPDHILLEAMGFAGNNGDGDGYHPTIGGLLLFGKNPAQYLPHVYIRVQSDKKTRIFRGRLTAMLEDALNYLKQECIDNPYYPFNALEEVLINAVVHRDYLDTSRGIVVSVGDRYIEISNPGALMPGNSVYRSLRESNPRKRNAWLYQRLLAMDTTQRFLHSVSGLSKIQRAFSGIGQVKFVNIGSENLFKVILPRG